MKEIIFLKKLKKTGKLELVESSEEQVKSFVKKARKIYEQTGLRSDGTPLRAGDIEEFFSRFK